MSFSPVPDHKFTALSDITAGFLLKHGILLLMLDLDNTIAPYGTELPPDGTVIWAERIKDSGIMLCIISNSKKKKRVSSFANALEIPYIYRAKKPLPHKICELLKKLDIPSEKAALVGDQIYTDVLSANLANVMSIVVRPIKFTNPFLALRYVLELPFRSLRRTK